MNPKTQDLIEIASELLEKRYAPPVHSVASVILTKSGEIITGINIDHFNAFVCAETAALSSAINQQEYEFEKIVSVRKEAGEKIVVANMCGKCRQIFHDYSPGIKVVVFDEKGDLHEKTIEELLPFSFKRQQEKIHSIIEGKKIS